MHGNIFGRFYPLFYSLLSDKSEASYDINFSNIILNLVSVKHVICDFEKALINSIREKFKGVKIYGCLFHFGQMIWRNIQEKGLTNAYKYNNDVCKAIKMLAVHLFQFLT